MKKRVRTMPVYRTMQNGEGFFDDIGNFFTKTIPRAATSVYDWGRKNNVVSELAGNIPFVGGIAKAGLRQAGLGKAKRKGAKRKGTKKYKRPKQRGRGESIVKF